MHLVYIFCLLLVSSTCLADVLDGRVARVVDGDTLVLLDSSNTQYKIRLAGIDTAERGQPFGKRARENLVRIAGGQPARVEWYKKDRWNRFIGKVWVRSPDSRCQGEDCPKTLNVGMAKLTQGLAWHFKRYSHEQSEEDRERYAFAEEEARTKGIGLWSDPDPVPLWEWRRRR